MFYQLQNLVRRLGVSNIEIVGSAPVCSKAVVFLLLSLVICVLIACGGLGVVIGLCFDMHYLVPFLFCNHLAEEETRALIVSCC